MSSDAVPPISPTPVPVSSTEDIEKNKVFAILAYLGILFLVPLLAAKESPFARYHTNQGLVLFLASIAAWIALAILAIPLALIPFVGLILSTLLWFGVMAGWFILAVIGIINAANGRMKPLPVIGEKFTLIK